MRENESVIGSYPSSDGKGWTVEMIQSDQHDSEDEVIFAPFTVYAVCVRYHG